jgi:hypothetical protein
LSESSKKQPIDDERPVFDSGALLGIGHNQGPPIDDPEPEPDADTETQPLKRGRRVSGSKLSKEDIAWLRAKEKSGELEKVTWDSPYGSDVVANFERRLAGPSRGADPSSGEGNCKWRNPDGAVSRRGYRRIFHVTTQAEDSRRGGRIDEVQRIAARVLRGRNATIFERSVLYPLTGLQKAKPEE